MARKKQASSSDHGPDHQFKQPLDALRAERYVPWISVHRFLSRGRAGIIPGVKICRSHHVLSQLEEACLVVLEYQQNVLDIREQSPLLPVELTVRLAAELGIRHPQYPESSIPCVLTTDFCVEVGLSSGIGAPREVAIAVKYSADLHEKRVRERLSIEYEANKACGRGWVLFTEDSVDKLALRNLYWLRRSVPSGPSPSSDRLNEFSQSFRSFHTSARPLEGILGQVARHQAITVGEALRLFRCAVWHHVLLIDVCRPLNLREAIAVQAAQRDILDL